MKLINKIKINFYPELKNLNFEDQTLNAILSNKKFKSQYKKIIKPFIKHLREYNSKHYDYNSHLDNDVMNQQIKAAFELSIKNNANKYISFITENYKENYKIINYKVFNDPNFNTLFSMINYEIFNDNISEIINKGQSEKLIEFINNNGTKCLKAINSSLFEDKVWNIIKANPSIGNKNITELLETNSMFNVLVNLIKQDLFEGLKYTYENIPESHNFIEVTIKNPKKVCLQQFSMDFISKIGTETLKKLYTRQVFSNENEFTKLFEIVDFNNYELIQDIINYDSYNFSFQNISKEDMQKPLLETNINYYNKKEVFINKYFGIKQKDIQYIELFLNQINKVNDFPNEFKEKYNNILQLLNNISTCSNEEIIKISKSMKLKNKDNYKKLIEECEKDGNEILKTQFVKDLKIKNQQIINQAEKKERIIDNEKVTVYELTGQPFTMLVHAICNNKESINNEYVKKIINDPENWNTISGGNNHVSTSLISDRYMAVYGTPNDNDVLMFGFNEIPSNCLKYTDITDVGIDRNAPINSNYNMRARIGYARINTIATIDDLIEKTIENQRQSGIWNEIGLSRIDETTGMKIQPNFIVCMDTISDSSLNAAQKLNIPIYFIKRKYYNNYPNKNTLESNQIIESGHLKR